MQPLKLHPKHYALFLALFLALLLALFLADACLHAKKTARLLRSLGGVCAPAAAPMLGGGCSSAAWGYGERGREDDVQGDIVGFAGKRGQALQFQG